MLKRIQLILPIFCFMLLFFVMPVSASEMSDGIILPTGVRNDNDLFVFDYGDRIIVWDNLQSNSVSINGDTLRVQNMSDSVKVLEYVKPDDTGVYVQVATLSMYQNKTYSMSKVEKIYLCNKDLVCSSTGTVYYTMDLVVPELPDNISNNYALYLQGDYWVLIDNMDLERSEVVVQNNRYYIYFYLKDGTTADLYRINKDSGISWNLINGDLGNSFIDIELRHHLVHYPTDLTLNGEPFFQLPLTLAETVRQGILKTYHKVVGTMEILLLCGVGCLALLMALKVFGKVLRPYLP